MLIPVCTIITFLINIAIMSAAGTAARWAPPSSPFLIRAGIRPAGAAAAVAGGTMCGLLLNPGCAHDIYIAQMAKMELMDFIGWAPRTLSAYSWFLLSVLHWSASLSITTIK